MIYHVAAFGFLAFITVVEAGRPSTHLIFKNGTSLEDCNDESNDSESKKNKWIPVEAKFDSDKIWTSDLSHSNGKIPFTFKITGDADYNNKDAHGPGNFQLHLCDSAWNPNMDEDCKDASVLTTLSMSYKKYSMNGGFFDVISAVKDPKSTDGKKVVDNSSDWQFVSSEQTGEAINQTGQGWCVRNSGVTYYSE